MRFLMGKVKNRIVLDNVGSWVGIDHGGCQVASSSSEGSSTSADTYLPRRGADVEPC
ncbi:hypothetical protein Mapa_015537 [Marchantia paleacea]|nr:hypothetical protein Mapa_015537 [Marchantia paleacea]